MPLDAQQLRALAEKATPGPWAYSEWIGHHDELCMSVDAETHAICSPDYGHDDSKENALYITACDPQTILALLADRDRLRAALEQALLDIGMVAADGATSGIAGDRIRAALKETAP